MLSGLGGVPAAPLAVKFHIDRRPIADTQLINDRQARQVPGTDVFSGNSGDHRIVDQAGGAVRTRRPVRNFTSTPDLSGPRINFTSKAGRRTLPEPSAAHSLPA